jgi:hypothetical protein
MKYILQKIIAKTFFWLRRNKVSMPAHFSSYFKNAKLLDSDYHKTVLSMDNGNTLIYELLKSNNPFLVCRFGDVELNVVSNYIYNKITGENKWNEYNKAKCFGILAIGIPTDLELEMFSKIYLENINVINALAVWNNRGEDFITRYLCPAADLIPLQTLEPFFFSPLPWSKALEGKKVLVIHPYDESITNQHKIHQLLFDGTFPAFDLVTYRPFNVITQGSNSKFDWFEELEKMKSDVANLSFDVALVAAGPFGFPLAAHIKNIGKQAIHVGGALQLFFGIKGRRWENSEHKNYFNDYWIYPSDSETPALDIRTKLDNGDYWK